MFSFHGFKILTTGEGGMLVTNDEHLYSRALVLKNHGRPPGDTSFVNREVGHKYKMSSMQAALGLAQLERVAPRGLDLPSALNMTRDRVATVARARADLVSPS